MFYHAVDQSWRRPTEDQEKEIRWIRENISIVLRRSTVLLNRYSLHSSGLAPLPNPCKCLGGLFFSIIDIVALLIPMPALQLFTNTADTERSRVT